MLATVIVVLLNGTSASPVAGSLSTMVPVYKANVRAPVVMFQSAIKIIRIIASTTARRQ